MKSTNRVRRNGGIKPREKQEVTSNPSWRASRAFWASLTPGRLALEAPPAIFDKRWAEAAQIGKMLKLTPRLTKSLVLITEWEGQTPLEYCRSIVLSLLETSFDDMKVLAGDNNRPREKAWARQFISSVQPIFENGGVQ